MMLGHSMVKLKSIHSRLVKKRKKYKIMPHNPIIGHLSISRLNKHFSPQSSERLVTRTAKAFKRQTMGVTVATLASSMKTIRERMRMRMGSTLRTRTGTTVVTRQTMGGHRGDIGFINEDNQRTHEDENGFYFEDKNGYCSGDMANNGGSPWRHWLHQRRQSENA